MSKESRDFIFIILMALFILGYMLLISEAFACVSECTYTGDVTVWRDDCYTVARCVDRQEDGFGSCFDESTYFKLEEIDCRDIISRNDNGEEDWNVSKERYGQ